VDIEGAVEATIVEITVDIEVVVVMIDTEDHLHPTIDVMITDDVQDLDLTHHVGDKTPTTTESADLMEYSFPILSIEMIDHTAENNV